MRFARSLQFNCNPDWSEYYISYEHLKKLIYQIEKAEVEYHHQQPQSPSDVVIFVETNRLQNQLPRTNEGSSSDYDSSAVLIETNYAERLREIFVNDFKGDLNKVFGWYDQEKRICFERIRKFNEEVIHFDEQYQQRGYYENSSNAGQFQRRLRRLSWPHLSPPSSLKWPNIIETNHLPSQSQHTVEESHHDFSEIMERIKATAKEIYITAHDLHDYLQLNYTGFFKILKKHDKVTRRQLRPKLSKIVEMTLPLAEISVFDQIMQEIEDAYGRIVCRGNRDEAVASLKHLLRERLVFERSTVWQDLVKMERRASNVAAIDPIAPERISRVAILKKVAGITAASTLFFGFLFYGRWLQDEAQRNCMAMVLFVSVLWCTETLPLFVTSMMVPFLTVILRVLKDPTSGIRLDSSLASIQIFHSMFSQVIMLLLGGFAMAAALSKYGIARGIALKVLAANPDNRNPAIVLLKVMGISALASMWISNVAAPVLCYSIIQPFMRHLSVDSPIAKSLVLGVAIGANIGGMASPISSPQNIIAIEQMMLAGFSPTWIEWLSISIPVCLISLLLCWAFLCRLYRCEDDPDGIPDVVLIRGGGGEPISKRQIIVSLIALLTIVLWCGGTKSTRLFGEMGVVALIPLVGYFGSGLLNKDDFNGFLWNVVMLAMGGLALGEAIKSSGLLMHIGHWLVDLFAEYSLIGKVTILCAILLVITTFISHTVGALIFLPLMGAIGEAMGSPHPRLLIMAGALTCSVGMGLPISGFPNINAVAQEDATGKTYLKMRDFVRGGIPSSLIAFSVVLTVGVVIMTMANAY